MTLISWLRQHFLSKMVPQTLNNEVLADTHLLEQFQQKMKKNISNDLNYSRRLLYTHACSFFYFFFFLFFFFSFLIFLFISFSSYFHLIFILFSSYFHLIIILFSPHFFFFLFFFFFFLFFLPSSAQAPISALPGG